MLRSQSLVPCALTAALALLLASCGFDEQGGGAPSVSPEQARSVALSKLPFAELELPADSREGVAPPARIPLEGPWKYAGTTKGGMHKWAMDIPIRPRSLFFHNAQPGMALHGPDGAALPYDRGGATEPSWEYNRTKLIVHLPERGDGPAPGAYTFTYDRAIQRERSLNLALSGEEDPARFAWTSIFDDWDSRTGLLLPAPGKAAWDVEVPPAGELLFQAGISEPEVLDGRPSDGARLVVEVDGPEGAKELWAGDLAPARFEPVRVDLSAFAGQKLRLRVRSEPKGDARFDYVFLGQPVVSSRSADPRRVVLVFVDTLRPDHMSLYGYARETSPKVDAWAQDAVVFEQARSVAPWTLPSARTVITGRHPEFYDVSQTLQRRLGDEGWTTAMFAGNVYLSANFDMHRDWGLHRVGLFPSAEEVTDDALAFLDAHEGRDAMIQVHYMDPHLPYLEPKAYRFLFAGDPKGGLGEEFHLSDVRRARVDDQATKDYIRDRYDNNIRYATDQVGRLLERLDDNDIVIFYADHGEEFWDHRGFEHGHTLFDELLRVPLVIDGPGLSGRRVDAPVSLLDLTPTVLDLLGMEHDGLDGTSLLAVAKGDEAAAEQLGGRDLAFGRPLYGTETWGVLHAGTQKWTTREGREALYDVSVDPDERNNLIANKEGEHGAPYHAHLAEALGAPVEVGYRIFATHTRGGPPEHDLVARMRVPGGVKHASVAHDPLLNSSAEVTVDGDVVEVTWHAGYAGSRDIHVIPALPLEEVTHGIEVELTYGAQTGEITVDPRKDPGLGKHRTPLGRKVFSNRTVALTYVIAPVFSGDAKGIVADDPEVTDALKAMGYVTD